MLDVGLGSFICNKKLVYQQHIIMGVFHVTCFYFFPIRQNSFRTINQSIVNEKFSLYKVLYNGIIINLISNIM